MSYFSDTITRRTTQFVVLFQIHTIVITRYIRIINACFGIVLTREHNQILITRKGEGISGDVMFFFYVFNG